MRAFMVQVFDDLISGTSTTWYTPAEFNDLLGRADAFSVAAVTTNVSGTTPRVTIQGEHSCDAQNWIAIPSGAEINNVTISNDGLFHGSRDASLVLLRYMRLRITLAGTNPQCRLKLYVTGRTVGAGG